MRRGYTTSREDKGGQSRHVARERKCHVGASPHRVGALEFANVSRNFSEPRGKEDRGGGKKNREEFIELRNKRR